MKFKNASNGISDVDKERNVIVGYAAHFNNKDSHNDIIKKGAFKRTIDHNGKRIKALMHHDPVMLVGKPQNIYEDEKGLYTETFISKTSQGRDLLTLVEDEVLDEMSIGYFAVDEEFDSKQDANILKEIKLVEYSFLTLGSNDQAQVQGMKGLFTVDQVVESMKRMEKSLRNSYFETDEIPERVEFALRYWRSIMEEQSKGMVDESNIVNSESPSEDSADKATPEDDSAEQATRDDEVLGYLKQKREELEIAKMIRNFTGSL